MNDKRKLSRRDFLKLTGLGLGSLVVQPWKRHPALADFPDAERLGRVNTGRVTVRLRPDIESEEVGVLYEDAIVPWLREVIGSHPYRVSQRWVETPDGYIWAPLLQPVRVEPNAPISSLPDTSMGPGLWVEVTVPYVDLSPSNPPARSPWLQNTDHPRLYYGQVVWVDEISVNNNNEAIYHVKELYGSYGDMFWASADAFLPLTEADIAPIHPEVEEKKIVIDLTYQTLSCYEGNNEVYFCRISSGAKFDALGNAVDAWATPPGSHPTWRKLVSLHMSGGTTGGGWDLPGIGWTALFVGSGIAIHGTHWHNNFGVPMSHGCVNATYQDAKWVWRWMNPIVSYDPGDRSVDMTDPGTYVQVIES